MPEPVRHPQAVMFAAPSTYPASGHLRFQGLWRVGNRKAVLAQLVGEQSATHEMNIINAAIIGNRAK